MTHEIIQRPALSDAQEARMFELMERHYDCVDPARFREDLAWKDQVVLLFDDAGQIQGFTTIALNPKNTAGPDYDLFYSGDTVVAREHWGSQELVHGFSRAAGLHQRPGRRLIWFLLSKGHRTYLYLTLFAKRYYPSAEPARCHDSLRPIIDHAAPRLFGDAWKPSLGIVRFPASQGQLKEDFIDTSRANRHVRFFLERNPGFAEGDELVCATELTPENLRRHVRRGFEEGMASESRRSLP